MRFTPTPLAGAQLVAMEFATSRPVGDSMVLTIWGSTSSWTLTALPLFLWMGEILFRTKLSEDMFKGLAPWLERLPGRLLHVNVIGSTIFAAVSGSSAATCATIGRIALPELRQRGYPEKIAVGTLALMLPAATAGGLYDTAGNLTGAMESLEDVTDMGFDGCQGNIQLVGYGLVGQPQREQTQYLHFALAQRRGQAWRRQRLFRRRRG